MAPAGLSLASTKGTGGLHSGLASDAKLSKITKTVSSLIMIFSGYKQPSHHYQKLLSFTSVSCEPPSIRNGHVKSHPLFVSVF